MTWLYIRCFEHLAVDGWKGVDYEGTFRYNVKIAMFICFVFCVYRVTYKEEQDFFYSSFVFFSVLFHMFPSPPKRTDPGNVR